MFTVPSVGVVLLGPAPSRESYLVADKIIAAAKAIERLIAKGVAKRVSNGVFYKPKKSVFGELKPSEDELLKQYLFEKGIKKQ